MSRRPSEVDVRAPIRWVSPETFTAYFDSLPPDDRWTHPGYPDSSAIWHWEERRWWARELGTPEYP